MAVLASGSRRGCVQSTASRCTVRLSAARLPSRHHCVARAVKVDKEVEKAKEVAAEQPFTDGPDVAPSTQEVQQLLNTLVLDTEIAEMELKLGTFQMRVRRSVDSAESLAPPPAVMVAPAPPAAAPVFSAASYAAGADSESEDDSMNEALVYVTVPKVGVFRRGKYAGGKKVGKGNVANVGDTVKRGQTLGYVEQLGTFVEVKAPQAGEVATFKADDGDAVEYNQVVVELAPWFGGHIIGDSKYA